MKKRSSSALLVPAAALLLLAGHPAQAALQWDRNVSGTHSWTTGTNWVGGTAPSLDESQGILFAGPGAGLTNFTVQLDIEEDEVQILRGGLTFGGYNSNSTSLTLNFDLNQRRLILQGGQLAFWREAGASIRPNTVLFDNGTLQMGTASHAATVVLGAIPTGIVAPTANQDNILKIGSGATFDSVNVGAFKIVAHASNFTQQFTLDLSEANLVSGADQHTLRVAGTIDIGVSESTALNQFNKKQGELKLGELSSLQTTSLSVGRSFEANAITAVDRTNTGTLRFLADQTRELNVTLAKDLYIGAGKNAIGRVLDAPLKLNLTIGDAGTAPASRGVLHVGYKHLSGNLVNRTVDTSSGQFIAREGSFNAYLREMKIGVNDYTVGTADGHVDFSQMELGVLEISGDAVIGSGHNAEGQLALSGGSIFSNNLILGTATESGTGDPEWSLGRSGLTLDGTLWTIGNNLTIGAMGDLELRLGPDPALAGLDIRLALDLQAGGTLSIYFDTAPLDGPLWGLRIAGEHDDLLNSYIDSNQLLALGAFGSQATVFMDGQYTYYGIAAIPEPGFVALCGAGLLLLLAPRLRRRNG